MALEVGTRLGPYEILAPLGAGGMGEVYRAKDTRLDRTVALKVLPSELSANPALRERLEREARAVSSLNHPHICTLYDVGREGETDFLVMEHIEGETLADRLKKGPLPLDRALKHAGEIADALDKAHRQGVVHRDLKPGNIMLTKSGAKLLDFGLAKLQQSTTGAPALSQLPTKAKPLTDEGTVLGTFQYMSPEQLEGKEADARTDIFAFGAVLYEMLTGRRAFEGKSQASLIAAILEHDPPALTELQPMTPPLLDRVVRRCLEKDPDERCQSAGDLAAELRWIADQVSTPAAVDAPRRKREVFLWMGVAALSAVLVLSLWQGVRLTAVRSSGEPPLRRFAVTGTDLQLPTPAISPDGRFIAYAEGAPPASTLWVHDLERDHGREIEGTEGAFSPFWSPASDFIAFFSMTGELKRVHARGGAITTVCDLPGRRPGYSLLASSGTWSADRGSIVFSWGSRLYEVAPQGGTPALFKEEAASDEWRSLLGPHWAPSGSSTPAIVFSACKDLGDRGCRIVIQNVDTGERQELARGKMPAVSPTGHVLYSSWPDRVLYARPISLTTLQPTGDAFRVADRGWWPSVASDGTLAYVSGFVGSRERQLVQRDRSGRNLGAIGQPQEGLHHPRVSPKGNRVAVAGEKRVWICDVGRPIKSPLTSGESASGMPFWPTWSPGGDWLAYTRDYDILVTAADGGVEPKVLVASPSSDYLNDWSPDGRFILFTQQEQRSGDLDLWYVEDAGDQGRSEPVPFVERPAVQHLAMFSPDGRYVAYLSQESGRSEVYVERFPEGGGRWQVSSAGASQLRWGRSGEIFYVEHVGEGDASAPPIDVGMLVAVPVTTTPALTVGAPKNLFTSPGLTGPAYSPMYDVSADGQTFFIVEPIEPSPAVIRIVQNWYSEFTGHDPAPGE